MMYDFAVLYQPILEPFKNELFGPFLATLLWGIAALIAVLFVQHSGNKADHIKNGTKKIRGAIKNNIDTDQQIEFARNFSEIDIELLKNKTIKQPWSEFKETIIINSDNYIINTVRPNAFFNQKSLSVQYEFIRSLPNIFVGIGLLGTFIGLIAALTFSTQALTQADDPEKTKLALSTLLITAAAKFYISASGLVSSILLSILIKIRLKHINNYINDFNHTLEERLLHRNAEFFSKNQYDIQKESLDELKQFNTTIAMTIGDAVRNAIDQSNSNFTSKLNQLVELFEKLVNESQMGAKDAVGTAIDEAMGQSLKDASKIIQDVSTLMSEIPIKINNLTNQIKEINDNNKTQFEDFIKNLAIKTNEITTNVGVNINQALESKTNETIKHIQNAGLEFSNSSQKISTFLENFAANSDNIIKSLSTTVDKSSEIENKIINISLELISASESIQKVSNAMNDNLNSFFRGFQKFSDSAERSNQQLIETQDNIKQISNQLNQKMEIHVERYNEVDEKLATIFKGIITHLEHTHEQIKQQHSHMDQSLASAVFQLNDLIENLIDAKIK